MYMYSAYIYMKHVVAGFVVWVMTPFLTHLVHGVGEEGLQCAPLQVGFVFETVEEGAEVWVLLALGEHLQAVVVVPHVFLVDAQHWQQHVEQVSCSTVQ